MYRFANSDALYALILIPLLISFYFYVKHSKYKVIKKFGNIKLMQKLMLNYSS